MRGGAISACAPAEPRGSRRSAPERPRRGASRAARRSTREHSVQAFFWPRPDGGGHRHLSVASSSRICESRRADSRAGRRSQGLGRAVAARRVPLFDGFGQDCDHRLPHPAAPSPAAAPALTAPSSAGSARIAEAGCIAAGSTARALAEGFGGPSPHLRRLRLGQARKPVRRHRRSEFRERRRGPRPRSHRRGRPVPRGRGPRPDLRGGQRVDQRRLLLHRRSPPR